MTSNPELEKATTALAKPAGVEAATSSKKFEDHLLSPSFAITLSSSGETFHINRGLLAHHSPYFEALFSFKGQEAKTDKATLADPVDRSDAFRCVLQWIYHGTYTAPDDFLGLIHARIYVLAERLLMDPLKAAAVVRAAGALELEYRQLNGSVSLHLDELAEYVAMVYEYTPTTVDPKNSLRMVITRFVAARLAVLRTEEKVLNLLRCWPEFAVDLVLEVREGRRYDTGMALQLGNEMSSPAVQNEGHIVSSEYEDMLDYRIYPRIMGGGAFGA